MEIDLEHKKLELIQWLSSISDEELIDKLIELKNNEREEWYNSLSDSEKESIEKGLKDADQGKLQPHSKAREIYGKWL